LGPLTNKYLILGITASVTLEILVTELPFFQLAFGTTSLSVLDWVMVVLVSSSVFIAEEIRKLARLLFLKRKQNKQAHRQ
jgi:Ca2+-transporting ATPase